MVLSIVDTTPAPKTKSTSKKKLWTHLLNSK
jgi:hypothetical protein